MWSPGRVQEEVCALEQEADRAAVGLGLASERAAAARQELEAARTDRRRRAHEAEAELRREYQAMDRQVAELERKLWERRERLEAAEFQALRLAGLDDELGSQLAACESSRHVGASDGDTGHAASDPGRPTPGLELWQAAGSVSALGQQLSREGLAEAAQRLAVWGTGLAGRRLRDNPHAEEAARLRRRLEADRAAVAELTDKAGSLQSRSTDLKAVRERRGGASVALLVPVHHSRRALGGGGGCLGEGWADAPSPFPFLPPPPLHTHAPQAPTDGGRCLGRSQTQHLWECTPRRRMMGRHPGAWPRARRSTKRCDLRASRATRWTGCWPTSRPPPAGFWRCWLPQSSWSCGRPGRGRPTPTPLWIKWKR